MTIRYGKAATEA